MLKDLITKNKLQWLLGLYLAILLLLFLYARISPSGIDRISLTWVFANIFSQGFPIAAFFFVIIFSLILFVIRKIKKNNDYLVFKKVFVVLLELFVLFLVIIGLYIFQIDIFDQTCYQVTGSLNKTITVGDIANNESLAIQKLFPNGNPRKKESRILYMKKLDSSCGLGDKYGNDDDIRAAVVNGCRAGQIAVVYGWSLYSDYKGNDGMSKCEPEHKMDYYLLENSGNGWKVIRSGDDFFGYKK